MLSYNLTTAALGLCGAAAIVVLVRRNVLYTRYVLWWMLVAAIIVVVGLFPRVSDLAAHFLGIGYPPALVFAAAIVFLLVKILLMDMDRSDQELRIRRLTQRLAILQQRLDGERDKDPQRPEGP